MPTISDVAKRAGVSLATVSRVLQGAKNVRPSTREKVTCAIEELGYVPSAVAQSMRSKRTRSLALVVSDITNPFWTTVARGVEDMAQRHDYSVLLYNTDENPFKQQRCLEYLVSRRVDGVIIAPYDSDARHLEQLRKRDIPTVLVDRRVEGWEVDSVYGDSVAGARTLVRHLLDLGHRRIAMLSGPVNTSTAEDRVTGYRMALAEFAVPLDPGLIKRGEFRDTSGEEMTDQLLDSDIEFSAIFAANNAIAMGAIDALGKRGLRIPQDIALVNFDDFPNTSRLFPFLTVVSQPAYDIGINSAQLLLSRLDSEVPLKPRHVVLPSRLVVRHSCGNSLREGEDECVLSLPLPKHTAIQSRIVKPLSAEDRREYAHILSGATSVPRSRDDRLLDYDKSDVGRLLKALEHQEPDRIPHFELWVTSQSVYEYVLEHELKYDIVDARIGAQSIAPEDDVEFALRLGMDAVVCNFSWRPNNVFAPALDGSEHYVGGSVQGWADLGNLEPPPSLADQMSYLERYLRAAQGTGVGVVANFTSFFDSAMLARGVMDSGYLFYDDRPFLEKLMDLILEHQEQVMRSVCDRFADDLAFVVINDDIAHNIGLMIHPDMFMEMFPHRMQRLIAPAKEHGKRLLMHSDGKLDKVLSTLYDLGFDAVHPIQPECNDIFQLKAQWKGKLAMMGNIPTSLLAFGAQEEIEEKVREFCERLGPGGGYVLSSSTSIMEGIPPENFVAMTRAVHRYGRYGSLGKDSRHQSEQMQRSEVLEKV